MIAGVIGARLYYVITDKSQPWKDPARALQIWNGGLGIPGALIGGIGVGMWLTKRRGLSALAMADACAPAIPLAQAIGRLGNWWNQELFGKPTTLPWGLRIDDEHLTQNGITYAHGTLFHPTFLYEALWNLALCLVLIWIGNHLRLRPGRLMVIYVFGYFLGRFWIEGLRIDNANAGGGLRLNQWVALVAMAASGGFLVVDWLRHRDDPEPALVMAAGSTGEADDPAAAALDDAPGPGEELEPDGPGGPGQAEEPADAAESTDVAEGGERTESIPPVDDEYVPADE